MGIRPYLSPFYSVSYKNIQSISFIILDNSIIAFLFVYTRTLSISSNTSTQSISNRFSPFVCYIYTRNLMIMIDWRITLYILFSLKKKKKFMLYIIKSTDSRVFIAIGLIVYKWCSTGETLLFYLKYLNRCGVWTIAYTNLESMH